MLTRVITVGYFNMIILTVVLAELPAYLCIVILMMAFCHDLCTDF
jgi:hypothetical protein